MIEISNRRIPQRQCGSNVLCLCSFSDMRLASLSFSEVLKTQKKQDSTEWNGHSEAPIRNAHIYTPSVILLITHTVIQVSHSPPLCGWTTQKQTRIKRKQIVNTSCGVSKSTPKQRQRGSHKCRRRKENNNRNSQLSQLLCSSLFTPNRSTTNCFSLRVSQDLPLSGSLVGLPFRLAAFFLLLLCCYWRFAASSRLSARAAALWRRLVRGGGFCAAVQVDIAVHVLRLRCAAFAKAGMIALYISLALAHVAAGPDAEVACVVRAAAFRRC